ncbi:MAG: membrane protein insertase YidC [Burkholderiales bacterium]|nr:membrane protein insertase YidC [Burkholderiales bacterium]
MDTRRLILFFIFSFSLVMLWDAWQKQQAKLNAPPPAPAAAARDATIPQPSQGLPTPAVPGSTPAVAPGAAPAASAPQGKLRVRTDVMIADIAAEGGDLRYVELIQHKDTLDKNKNFVLLGEHSYFAQTGLLAQGLELPTHKTAFSLPAGPLEMKAGEARLAVRLEAQMNGVKVAKIYTFHRGAYAIDVSYEIANGTASPIAPSVYLQLLRDGKAPAGDSMFLQTYTGPVFYTDAEKFQKQDFSDIDKNKPPPVKAAGDGWAGIIQHYFATAWLPQGSGRRDFYSKKVADNLYSAGMIVPVGTVAPGAAGAFAAKLYVGPQDQDRLKELSPGLDLVVDYGWLTIIAQPMFWLLKWLHAMLGNWGLAIIALTVIIKAVFFPLSAASYKSMARMKKVTPRLTQIRERYGNDRMKMNQAMMELYKEEKINPLGGCFPILVQIPVFIALYWVLLASVEMRHAPFYGWITDLSAQDPYYILPILMAVSMFVQTKMNPTPPDPIQAKMMLIMPVVFSVFFFFFPSGLVLYWVVNNVLSIAQQWQITRMIEAGEDPDKKKKK